MLLIPPQLVACLACFDGQQTTLDLRASLVQITGEIQVGEIEKHLYDTLSTAGFPAAAISQTVPPARASTRSAAEYAAPIRSVEAISR